jgi:hypothetical protein
MRVAKTARRPSGIAARPSSHLATGEYRIENRHQDEWWEDSGQPHLVDRDAAIRQAQMMATEAMVYGMTRVIDCATGEILQTFAAGGSVAS